MKKITTLLALLLVVTQGAFAQRTISENNLKRIVKLRDEVAADLTGNLLQWWATKTPDYVNGGFYGRVDWQDSVYAEADKGGVLHARILFAFSAAYRVTGDTSYLRIATRAKDYSIEYFIDKEFGGIIAEVDYKGVPKKAEEVDRERYIYLHTYYIYAFSEYARATGDKEALETAKALFETMEKHAFDQKANWYFEDFNRQWVPQPRRIDRDNTAVILVTRPPFIEALTNLYRVWPEERMAQRLRFVLETFMDKIVNPNTNQLYWVIDKDWISLSDEESCGHDIEATWLFREAALALGDPLLLKRAEDVAVKIARAVEKAIQPDGSFINNAENTRGTRSWWVQVEAINGYFDAWEITGEEKFLDYAINCWNYTRDHFIDKTNGGWFPSVGYDGQVRTGVNKAANWTGPYHNSRMEMEIMERVERILHNNK